MAAAKQTKTKKKDYVYAVGRRRTSVARVRLFRGKGESTVNGKKAAEYFVNLLDHEDIYKPFKITDTSGKYYFSIKVVGGGLNGQLGASVHAVAKAVASEDREKFRTALKKAGLLTRDSRIRERRKVNTGGKARRQKQSPKR